MGQVKRYLGITAMLLLGAAVLYLVVQIYAIMNPSYRTETAIYYEMSENIEMKAAAVFQRQTIEGGGTLGYLVEDGERVHPGQVIAERYSSPQQAQAQAQYRQLQRQVEMLQSSSKVQGVDVGAITRQLQDGLYSLVADLGQSNYYDSTEDFNSYLVAANKVQCLTGKTSGFDQRIAQIQGQMEALSAAVGTPETIGSPASGYFVRSEQAGVQPFSQEQLEQMTPQQLLEELDKTFPDNSQGVGEIITDYRWSLYGTTDSSLAQQLKAGQSVTLRLPERGGLEFPVKVEQVQADRENGLYKIKLSCQNITPQALGLGVERVEVVVNEYEGIRVPRSAEHIHISTDENGKEVEEYGVYVKLGTLMYFRKITNKLYQNEEYMLLPLNPSEEDGDEVRLYDEVIVEGTDLDNGKLI